MVDKKIDFWIVDKFPNVDSNKVLVELEWILNRFELTLEHWELSVLIDSIKKLAEENVETKKLKDNFWLSRILEKSPTLQKYYDKLWNEKLEEHYNNMLKKFKELKEIAITWNSEPDWDFYWFWRYYWENLSNTDYLYTLVWVNFNNPNIFIKYLKENNVVLDD